MTGCHETEKRLAQNRSIPLRRGLPVKSAVIEQVFVTWSQRWDVDQYIDRYLDTRRIAKSDAARASIRTALDRYPGTAPHTKADLDFFLDRNGELFRY